MVTADARLTIALVIAVSGGLAVGSFLNVVVYRVPLGLSVVRPGSFCPRCRTPLRSSDNVPVLSWLLLGRKCRTCRAPISARYPLVEGGAAALCAGVVAIWRPLWASPALCVVALTLLALVLIEIEGAPSPVAVPLGGGAIAVIALVVGALVARHPAGLGWPLVGGGAGLLVAALLAVPGAVRRHVGWGGLAAVALGGLALGAAGWTGAAAGAGAAGAAAAVITLARREGSGGRWPMGVVVASAVAVAVVTQAVAR